MKPPSMMGALECANARSCRGFEYEKKKNKERAMTEETQRIAKDFNFLPGISSIMPINLSERDEAIGRWKAGKASC